MLQFQFKKKNYSALVSFKEQGYDLNCQVRYIDRELAELFPSGKVSFSLSNLDNDYRHDNPVIRELLQNNSEAISDYLKTQTHIESFANQEQQER